MFALMSILSLLVPLILDCFLLPAFSHCCDIIFPFNVLFRRNRIHITSTTIITTENAASNIANKIESPIVRPTGVDTVAVVEGGSVLKTV